MSIIFIQRTDKGCKYAIVNTQSIHYLTKTGRNSKFVLLNRTISWGRAIISLRITLSLGTEV